MSKSNGTRPVSPCWYCGDTSLVLVHNDLCFGDIGDIRDKDWYVCAVCNATACENPIKLGPGPKVMPSCTATQLSRRRRKR